MASPLVAWGIPLFAVFLANGFVFAVDRAERELGASDADRRRRVALAALGAFGWMGFVAALALRGTLANFALSPSPLSFVLASAPALALGVGLSSFGERLARGLPLVTLVAVQGFRVPYELVLHQATRDGLLPEALSYAGYDYEIVSGVTAALLGGLLALGHVPLFVVAAWNALGVLLLGASTALRLAATPAIQAFGEYQVNSWVARFPFAWVTVMTAAAALGHVALTRRLLVEARRARAQGSR